MNTSRAVRSSWPASAALLVAALALCPQRALAQWTVIDPSNLVQNAYTAARTLQMIKHQVTQLDHQVRALQKLGGPNWRELPAYMTALDDLMATGEAIAYSAADLTTRLEATFPGSSLPLDLDVSQAEKRQLQRTLLTMHNALRSTRHQMQRVNTGLSELRTIKNQMVGIRGHQEALELGNTLSAFLAEELAMLRQGIAVMNNIIAVQASLETQRCLQREASTRAVYLATEARMKGASAGLSTSWTN